MRTPDSIPRRSAAAATRGFRSRGLGLGRRQCRLRQDPRAGAAGHQSAAQWRRAARKFSASPSPRRPPPTWRKRVFDTLARVDHARRCRARCKPSARTPAWRPVAHAAGAGAAAVRARAGNAGRAEGADHPRLLHPASAPVSVRGQCRRALQRARRGRADPAAGTADARRAARRRRRRRTARSAARWPPP